jgi:hypothetical protein
MNISVKTPTAGFSLNDYYIWAYILYLGFKISQKKQGYGSLRSTLFFTGEC